jgi:putative DNA primase/helicase
LENGLYDIQTGQLTPHSPKFLSTIRLSLTYDPQAKCPNIDKFLSEIMTCDDIVPIQELIGYSLIPDYSIQRAFLFSGEGRNGKSTLIKMIEAFVGSANCSHQSLQSLEQRFATSVLYGKLLNTFADIPSRPLEHVTMFKMLTGGDSIDAEQKFKSHFSFTNVARLIFSCNKPPIIREDSLAFWRRWIIINFPNQFAGDKADKKILEKLTTKEELSGLLNFALDGLHRLLITQEFTYSQSVEEVAGIYQRLADPISAFIKNCCENDPTAWVSTSELYDAYKQYCIGNKMSPVESNVFGKEIRDQREIEIRPARRTREGKQVPGYQGIKLKENQKSSGDSRDSGVNSYFKSNNNDDNRLKKGNNPTNPTNEQSLDNKNEMPEGF